TLRVGSGSGAGRDAERPDVRSHAERGNEDASPHTLSLVPEEPTPLGGGTGAGRAFSQRHYGMDRFGDLFTSRQLLALTTLARLVRETSERLAKEHRADLAAAVQACLALALGRVADL